MDITLDRIDELRARINVTYEEACNYLRAANGDVVEAILMYERSRTGNGGTRDEELVDKGKDVLERFRKAIDESRRKRLVVRQEDRTVAELPLAAGVIGAILAPKLAVIGAVAALVTRSTVDIEDTPEMPDL